MNHEKRNGFMTSSQASRTADGAKLEKPTQKFYTYIDENIIEICTNRSIKTELNVKATKWGKLMEVLIMDHLGLEYRASHESTIVHPTIRRFSGTPDLRAKGKIGEIKCYEPKKFGALSLCLLQEDRALLKSNFKDEYWQCVQNAILCNVPNAELIAFMPRKSELMAILEKIEEGDFLQKYGLLESDYYFMRPENIESLAYLPNDSPMQSLNSFEFVVPGEDKEWLLKRVEMGNKIIDEYKFPESLKFK